jgi:phospholipid N-methyltransferase
MRYLQECREFYRQCRQQFHTTGSVLPSSRFLARALASELSKPHAPARILEVGPGTGSVTRQILRAMAPGDQLDAVEINPEFVASLQRRLDGDPVYLGMHERVRIIHAPIEDMPGEGTYDFMVSGLPLNNFAVEDVKRIFRTYVRLLKPGGVLSYFEYQFIRTLKMPFVGRSARHRLHRLGLITGRYIRRFQFCHQRVFINFPPAMARHLRPKPVPTTQPVASDLN